MNINNNRPLYVGDFYFILNKIVSSISQSDIEICNICIYRPKHNKLYSSLHIPKYIFNTRANMIILPIILHYDKICHYNVLILHNSTRVVERFEPVDSSQDNVFNNLLKIALNDRGYKYICNNYKGPQYFEMYNTMNCGYWVCLYVNQRILYNSDDQTTFLSKWISKIKNIGYDNVINEYKKYISLNFNIDLTNDFTYSYIINQNPLNYYVYII